MTFRGRQFRAHLAGSTAILALCATAASAQTGDSGDIEQVVVSASRISIAGYSAPTPVTVVSAAQLEQDAYSNIADSVRNLPQVAAPPASFGQSQSSSTSGTAGANFANLRNLGASRTLILLDGQRVVNDSLIDNNANVGADINSFPQPLIQRIDVVTGGASASWGSDAVAGVVNFVLDKNFTGFKASVQGTDTSNGLYRTLYGDATWGGDFDGDRGHIELSVSARIIPDTVILTQENWYKGAYYVTNPAYAVGNGQSQLIQANNVGLAAYAQGGLITASPAGVAGPGVAAAAVNALRGIQFTGAGVPSIVNFGNLTNNTLSNGGSLTDANSEAPLASLTEPFRTYTFFGYGRYKLTPTIQASLQLNYNSFEGKTELPPTLSTATIVSSNAYLPASVAAAMQNGGITSFSLGIMTSNNYNLGNSTGANYWSQQEAGLAGVGFNVRSLMRGVFTLEGTIGNDWSWNAYWEHSETRNGVNFVADPINANLAAAEDAVTVTSANVGKTGLALGSIACRSTLTGAAVVANGITAHSGCVPLNVFGNGVASPAAIGYVTGGAYGTDDWSHQTLVQDAAEASMQGVLPWALPAGKVAVAFGAGYRKEEGKIIVNPIASLAGYGQGNVLPFAPHDYYVYEGFAEVDAPILKDNIVKSLDFNMAGRVTDYSTSGVVETWKLGATSQVIDDIKLRTTYSVDIRAPQLYDLYSQGQIALKGVTDPITQQTVQANEIISGNANLVPETARTISGGAVLTPTFIPGLSVSADWYHINVTGEISTVADTTILGACNSKLPSPVNPGQNGSLSDPLCALLVFNGPGGTLGQVNLKEINIASQTVSGLDIQGNYVMDLWDGTLTWASYDSYNDENTITNPGSGVSDIAGFSAGTSGGAVVGGPKWRGILSSTYAAGPYSFTVQTRWYGTAKSYQAGNTGNQATAATANLYPTSSYEVPATAYLDLRGAYKWNDNISFFGAIDNAQNIPPALVVPISSNTASGSSAFYGTNSQVYDMLGRTFRLGVRFNY